MDASTALLVFFLVALAFAFTALIVWHTTRSHVICVSEINKAWEAAARARDDAWARVVEERKLHANLEAWLVSLANQVAQQSENANKLTQTVVRMWEQGKIGSIQ